MTQIQPIEAKPSRIHGTGCFATRRIKKGHKIAEYEGERISRREIKRRLQKQGHVIHICGVNSYWAMDGRAGGNATKYINHSCAPNVYLKTINQRLFFYALREIKPGDELTLDYEVSWHQTECHCGAPNCRGILEGAEAA